MVFTRRKHRKFTSLKGPMYELTIFVMTILHKLIDILCIPLHDRQLR